MASLLPYMIDPQTKPSIFENTAMPDGSWIKVVMPYGNTPGNKAEITFNKWDPEVRIHISTWQNSNGYTIEQVASLGDLMYVTEFLSKAGSVAEAINQVESWYGTQTGVRDANKFWQALQEAAIHPDPKPKTPKSDAEFEAEAAAAAVIQGDANAKTA